MADRWRLLKIATGMAFLLGLWPAAGAWAAAEDKPLGHLLREVWTTREGLPHNLINGIAQTKQGYLWFATWEGAVSYNGRDFRLFGRLEVPDMPDEGFRAVLAARDGSVWFGSSRGGVARVRDGRWEFFGRDQGLTHAEVMTLMQSADGSIWIGYQAGGVDRLAPDGTVQNFGVEQGLPSPLVYRLAEDTKGRLWIATGEGLALLQAGEVSNFGAANGLPAGAVFAINAGSDGVLRVGGEFGLYALGQDQFLSLSPQLEGVAIQRLLLDRNGTLWAGATHQGLYRVRSKGEVDYFGTELGLPNQRIASLFEDREQSLWVGTSGGLMRLREGPFINLRENQGLADDYVRSVLQSKDGTLWIGSSTGLTMVKDGRVQRVGPDMLSVLTLAEANDGSILVGTYLEGVMRWRNGQLQPLIASEQGLPSNQVRALLADSQGALWMGTTLGLLRLKQGVSTEFTSAQGLPREYVLSLLQDRDGRVWVGTDKGMAWFNGETERFEAVALRDGAESVFGMVEDAAGGLWLASDRGLIYRKGNQVGRIGYAHGLPVEKLFQVVLDRSENVWVSSNRGVIKVPAEEAMAVVQGKAKRVNAEMFSELDGMASAQCNGGSSPSAIALDDGRLAFSTALGLSIVDPQAVLNFDPAPPPVVIERLLIDDQSVAGRISRVVQVPAGSRRLELRFAGLSFLRPQTIEYRYRLDGFDRDWVASGNRMSAEFTSLPPGDYRFRVSAALRPGLPHGPEAIVDLHVMRFWWQQPLTWTLAILFAILLLVLLAQYRIAKQREARAVLQRLVDERTEALREQTLRLVSADQERERLVEQLRQQSEAFERQAREDALTGLANRRAFDELLMREFARYERLRQPLCLAVIDLDWFKRINDDFSHGAGDRALKAVANVLDRGCRGMDAVARYGGEEFALVLPNTSLDEAIALASRLREQIALIDCSDFAPGESLTASFGVSQAEGCPSTVVLVERADAALYAAKRGGRNRVCAWPAGLENPGRDE